MRNEENELEKITFEKLPEAVAYLINKVEVLTELIKTTRQNKPVEKSNLLSIPEACKLMGITRGTLYRWEERGDIKFYAMGGRRYLKENEILYRLNKNKLNRKQ